MSIFFRLDFQHRVLSTQVTPGLKSLLLTKPHFMVMIKPYVKISISKTQFLVAGC